MSDEARRQLAATVAKVEAAIEEACRHGGSVDGWMAKVHVADLRLLLAAVKRGEEA